MKTKKNTSKRQINPPRKPSLWDQDWLDQDSVPALPVLRFSPTAWAKLLYFRDQSPNEVGGFGITDPDDLLLVKDFITVKQQVTGVGVRFDDAGVADFFDRQVDLGRKPEQFARIWCHSHPEMSPEPSATDEETFQRVFGRCDWALMLIVAMGRSVYCRLSFNVGPGGQVLIPVRVDCTVAFEGTDHEAWDAEYAANVQAVSGLTGLVDDRVDVAEGNFCDYGLPYGYGFMDDFQDLDPEERQMVLDELACQPDLWDQESEVMLL